MQKPRCQKYPIQLLSVAKSKCVVQNSNLVLLPGSVFNGHPYTHEVTLSLPLIENWLVVFSRYVWAVGLSPCNPCLWSALNYFHRNIPTDRQKSGNHELTNHASNNKAHVTCQLPTQRMSTYCATWVHKNHHNRFFNMQSMHAFLAETCHLGMEHLITETGKLTAQNQISFNVTYLLKTQNCPVKFCSNRHTLYVLRAFPYPNRSDVHVVAPYFTPCVSTTLLAIAGWNYGRGRDYQ